MSLFCRPSSRRILAYATAGTVFSIGGLYYWYTKQHITAPSSVSTGYSFLPFIPIRKDHSRAVTELRNQDIYASVSTFIQSNVAQPLVGAVASLFGTTAAEKPRPTLTERRFYDEFFNTLKMHIGAHPWQTGFFIIGIVLLCNPLAIMGFGSLGPIAGSLAAAWQSTMGGAVAAGSVFATLQSWGMVYFVVIPVIGMITMAGSAAFATMGERIVNAAHSSWAIASAGVQEVERWIREQHSNPVTQWWNSAHIGEQIANAAHGSWAIANAGAREVERWSRQQSNPVTQWWNSAHIGEQIANAAHGSWVVANAGVREVERLSRGQQSNPVTQWWNSASGNPVTRWWKEESESTLTQWANWVTKR